jgi:hypothetical protein
MKTKILILLCLFFLFISCAPRQFTPYKPTDLKIESTPLYSIKSDLESIPKPDKLVPMYVQKTSETNFEVVEDSNKATHILLAPEEYAKVGAVIKLAKTYKEIILINESIVNTYIDQINALKELSSLEREKVISYRELWVNSENMYRQEKFEHKTDNIINKGGMYIISLGSLLLLLLAL